jgi:hypothetical protein
MIYPNHRLPPWPNEDVAPRSLEPIVRRHWMSLDPLHPWRNEHAAGLNLSYGLRLRHEPREGLRPGLGKSEECSRCYV